MKRRSSRPCRCPFPGLLLVLAAISGACRHTYQETVEPSKEQKLELYTTTATYLYEDGNMERAQEQAVKALEVDPEHRAMRRMIGWIRLRLNQNDDLVIAERFFRDLVRDGDDNGNTLLGLAITCERMGKAYDEVSKAIATGTREPEDGQDREVAARDLAGKAHDYWQEAIGLLEGLLSTGEGDTNAMNALQRVHAMAGHYQESLDWSDRLLTRTEEELTAWRRMLQEEDLTEAEERLFRENERIATSLLVDTHVFAATLLFRLQRYDDALAHLDAVVASSPDLAQAYSLRGQVRSRVGEYQGAIQDFDRYLSLSDAPYEHPDVKKAFELRAECQGKVESR